MAQLYLGVDAGNSKTDALACLASGEVVGSGRAGCGDIYGAPSEQAAVASVLAAADCAIAAAGAARAHVAAAAFRLAGVDWPDDQAFWEATLDRQWPQLPVRSVRNDGFAALRCAAPSGVGVAVLAGTGAAIGARGPDGREWHLGFWAQHEMGAHGLVGQAVQAVCLAELGAGPSTALTAALLAGYGHPDVRALREWLTRRAGRATQEQRLSAARTVVDVAADGDPVAAGIVDEQGRRLALYGQVAAGKVGLTAHPFDVVASGSVLAAPDSPVATAFRRHLGVRVPAARISASPLPPVAGATLDALAEAGGRVDGETVARLAATLPRA